MLIFLERLYSLKRTSIPACGLCGSLWVKVMSADDHSFTLTPSILVMSATNSLMMDEQLGGAEKEEEAVWWRKKTEKKKKKKKKKKIEGGR